MEAFARGDKLRPPRQEGTGELRTEPSTTLLRGLSLYPSSSIEDYPDRGCPSCLSRGTIGDEGAKPVRDRSGSREISTSAFSRQTLWAKTVTRGESRIWKPLLFGVGFRRSTQDRVQYARNSTLTASRTPRSFSFSSKPSTARGRGTHPIQGILEYLPPTIRTHSERLLQRQAPSPPFHEIRPADRDRRALRKPP